MSVDNTEALVDVRVQAREYMLNECVKSLKRNGGNEDDGKQLLQAFMVLPERINDIIDKIWVKTEYDDYVFNFGKLYRGRTLIDIYTTDQKYLKATYEHVKEMDPELKSVIVSFLQAHKDDEILDDRKKRKARKLVLE